MKRKLITTLVFLCLGVEASFGYGSTSSWPTIPEAGTNVGVVGQTFTEDFSDTTSGASLVKGYRPNPTNSSGYGIDFICESASDPECLASNGSAEMLLPHCSIDDTSMCVESLYLRQGTNKIDGIFDRMVKSKKVIGNPSLGIPNGYNSSLWTVPGIPNAANEITYSVYASYVALLNGRLQKFRVTVNPFYLKRDPNFREHGFSESPSGDGGQRIVGQNGATGCVWIEAEICGYPTNFAGDVQVGVIVRVSNQVRGWLNGRVQRPEINFTRINENVSRLEVVGTPTTVQKVYGKTLITTGDKEVVDSIRYLGWNESSQYLGTTTADDVKSIPVFELWRKYIPDEADSMRTYWSFAVAGSSDQKCFAEATGVVGIVTTNAVVYEPSAPAFINNELQYRVAGVPLTPTKERFPGSYDLVLDSKVARCLYGFTDAPIKASVSVSAEDGARVVETTVTGEKNGWFSLGAYGFGFSSPTIKVRLSQETTEVKTSAFSEESTKAERVINSDKKTEKKLFCIKGSKSKPMKVGTKKCPKGYKKA
jgi:hypothetical protein